MSTADPRRPLEPLPPGFAATRESLHAVAEKIVAPARRPENEISLRATPGGFGTPAFEHAGVERQVRVEGAELVYRVDGDVRRAPLTSLEAAAALVAELLPAGADVEARELEVSERSARALAAWFALGAATLDRLRAAASPADDPTIARLWPEHFDIAIESGEEAAGRRANYGFSPGDELHPEPYLYVGPWRGEVEGELWNATGFTGAELPYAKLAATDDPLEAALDFCLACKHALDGMEVPG